MKKSLAPLLAAALAVVAASPALAGGKYKCSSDTQTCLNHFAEETGKRGWLGIEYDEAEKTAGPTVSKVIPGSPAEAAGFKPGDVLVAINGIKLNDENQEKLKAAKKDLVPGAKITYTVVRGGAEQPLAATLAKMPEQVYYAMVGQHMLEHATSQTAQK